MKQDTISEMPCSKPRTRDMSSQGAEATASASSRQTRSVIKPGRRLAGGAGTQLQDTTDGGYVLTGEGVGGLYLLKTDAHGEVLWERSFGVGSPTTGYSVYETADGGYVVGGSQSEIKIEIPGISHHAYLLKTDTAGKLLWEKRLRTKDASAFSAQEATDGGVILAGQIADHDPSHRGGYDAYLVKLVSQALFTRGDVNTDDQLELSDATYILSYLFLGAEAPSCSDAADTDDSGSLELTDAVYLLNHLSSEVLPHPRLSRSVTKIRRRTAWSAVPALWGGVESGHAFFDYSVGRHVRPVGSTRCQ